MSLGFTRFLVFEDKTVFLCAVDEVIHLSENIVLDYTFVCFYPKICILGRLVCIVKFHSVQQILIAMLRY